MKATSTFSRPTLANNSGTLIVTALLILIARVGIMGAWITFPLTEAISGHEIVWEIYNYKIFPAILFLSLFITGAVLIFIYRPMAAISLGSSLAILIIIPLYAAFGRSDWLNETILQTNERKQLSTFLSEHMMKNLNQEPTFISVSQFDTPIEQLLAGIAMLSMMWVFCLTANLVLIAVVQGRSPGIQGISLVIGGMMVTLLSFTYQSATDIIDSNILHKQGDTSLLNGEMSQARYYYEKAFFHNPALGHSTPFLIKFSQTYTNIEHPFNNLGSVLAGTLSQTAGNSNQAVPLTRKLRLKALETINLPGPFTPLEQQLVNDINHTLAKLWVFEGLIFAKEKMLNQALNAFIEASRLDRRHTTLFYVAQTYLDMGDPGTAITLLTQLTNSITHSSYLADIHCTIGDAQTKQKQYKLARASYWQCKDLDEAENFRVLKALTGS
ncbi:MAG: hypothetical protein HQL69_11890 [Magnetococcales bacterium]|nr:hypothetical protein [Magnetococcales bacterium]